MHITRRVRRSGRRCVLFAYEPRNGYTRWEFSDDFFAREGAAALVREIEGSAALIKYEGSIVRPKLYGDKSKFDASLIKVLHV